MSSNLVIVESPAKAKTIEKFLGEDFRVLSCYGHIRDLPEKTIGIDIKNNFEPQYEVYADKEELLAKLRKEAQKAEVVWLASDEDREGEAIAWHLKTALNQTESGRKKSQNIVFKRIVFNEITKNAILKAIENPREVDENLVHAQQARRVLDRLVGYELSPILWRKVKKGLSAGRVQSVALKLVCEREKEIKDFVSTSSFRAVANFGSFSAEASKTFATEAEAEAFLNDCAKAKFSLEAQTTKPGKRMPAPPFTTSTLQQEASRKLGFSVSRTMMVAQQLYENGYITYMRTDSVNLSSLAINAAKEQIEQKYGSKYHKARNFETKSKGAQEAHEAIRPTYLDKLSIDGDASQKKLYDLIWKRTIASQMAEAELEKTEMEISISNRKEKFLAKGEVVVFDGFLKVYIESSDDDKEEKSTLLPSLKIGEELFLQHLGARERFTQHPPRYTEAALVKKMEELGIGRPSTYAPTISTIMGREYVQKEDRSGEERNYVYLELEEGKLKKQTLKEKFNTEKAKLFPSDIGNMVTDYLETNFADILDYSFTAMVEKQFDSVASGKKEWRELIGDFYSSFHKEVETAAEKSQKVTGERLLGVDPKTGENVYVRLTRYGPAVQRGDVENSEKKPVFASLPKGKLMEEISLEEALSLLSLPRSIGMYEDEEITANRGRFGPYIKHAAKFYNIGTGRDIFTINLEEAIEIIEEKRKAELSKHILNFEAAGIEVLNGRFGPYIKKDGNNYKIPKGTQAEALTLQDCLKIIEESASKPSASKTKTTYKKAASKTYKKK